MNHFTQLLFILFMSSSPALASQGTGSSGGGSGIVFKDGSVHLADLLPTGIDPARIASSEEVKQLFFVKNRYVKTIAQKNESFFECAIRKISNTHLSFKNQWIESLVNVRVLNVEFPLIPNSTNSILNQQPFPIFADSSEKIGLVNQVALASYSRGDLWVQKRFYNALSENDQCGLSVHEAIRHLNYSMPSMQTLSTAEIEDATRALMITDEIALAQSFSKKFSPNQNLKHVYEMARFSQSFISKLSENANLQETQMEELRNASLKFSAIEAASEQNNLASKSLTHLADLLLDAARTVADYRYKYWDIQSPTERTQFKELAAKALDYSNDLYTSSAAGVASDFGTYVPDNYFDRVLINAVLVKKLSGTSRFDVKEIKMTH